MKTRNPTIIAFLVLVGAACSPWPGSGSGSDGATDPTIPVPGDPGFPQPTPSSSPGYPKPCHPIYAQEHLPTFELEMTSGELARIRDEAEAGIEDWHPAVFRYDGEEIAAMVRNRGNKKSCGSKLQLAISFNRENKDARFRGLRRINLDAGHCRIMDERLAFAFARDVGLPAPCANHARLEINGEYEGLFTNVEVQNKDFLTRNFGPDGNDGNLWKEGGDLKTNEDDPFDDESLEAFRNADNLETLMALGDLEYNVVEWAMEAALPATDNFWVDGWNYYLYEHPERGFMYIPRDFDKALPWTAEWAVFDPVDTVSHHPATIVLDDPFYRQRYLEALRRIVELYDDAVFEQRIETWWAQIQASAVEDPNLGVDPGEGPPDRLYLHIPARAAFLRERMSELAD